MLFGAAPISLRAAPDPIIIRMHSTASRITRGLSQDLHQATWAAIFHAVHIVLRHILID